MTTRRLNNTLSSVQSSMESVWNRMVINIRTKKMPKTIKRVKQTLEGKKTNRSTELWERSRETELLNNTVYYVRYMGSTLLEELVDSEPGANYHNTGLSAKALDRVVRMTRNNKLMYVSVSIGSQGIQVMRLPDKHLLLDVPMHRVNFCTNDKRYSKVAAFIARNSINGTMECHAFLCHRQKVAKSLADKLLVEFLKSEETRCQTDERLDRENNRLSSVRHSSVGETTTAADKYKKLECGDCDTLPRGGQVSLKDAVYEENHNLVSTATNKQPNCSQLIDDSIEPITRARADSDTMATMATGANDSNADLELEFSNFARSRSTTNLNELRTSAYSSWNI